MNRLTSTNSIKVVTYNILFSRHNNEIITNIQNLAKDGISVFCLQEVLPSKNSFSIVEQIIQELGGNWKSASHLGEGLTLYDFGTAIIWNSNILKSHQFERKILPLLDRLAIHEKIFSRLIGHKGTPTKRRVLTGLFTYKDKEILISSIHLDNNGGTKHRIHQLKTVMSNIVTRYPLIPHVLCGDFNNFDLLKTGYEKTKLIETLGKEYTDATYKIDWSADLYNIDIPHDFPLFVLLIKKLHIHLRRKLDYVWVKKLKPVISYKVVAPGSDHYPIVVELLFPTR